MSSLRALAAMAVPAAIMGAAWALGAHTAALPPAYASLASHAPVIVLAIGALLAAGFQRGRVFFAILTLAVAYYALRAYPGAGFTARTVFAAVCLLAQVNFIALALMRERGIYNLHGLLRAGVIALEGGITAWLAASGNRETVDWLYQPLSDTLTNILTYVSSVGSRIPQAALLLMAAGVITAIVLWWRSRSAIDLAFASAMVAWGIAVQGLPQREWHMAFIAAAALILSVAVLQDVYRMAFRDELTGVPGRRALNEHLARLGSRFAIAVIDIDHFKKFNDTHGHDVGDQVLKMVATRIERVRGGGSAYRFGGEEFVVVFPRATCAQALPHLEALRVDVANHGLTLRASERPVKTPARTGAHGRARKASTGGKKLSVNISIGVAECNDKFETPAAVLTAADKALYRAKRAGRNRVSQ